MTLWQTVLTGIGLWLLFIIIVLGVAYSSALGCYAQCPKEVRVFINTHDAEKDAAEACKLKFEQLGFEHVSLRIGEHDPRFNSDKLYRKNRSFVSSCLDVAEGPLEYALMVEPDCQVISKYLGNFYRALAWCVAHPSEWELLYGGCAARNPAFFSTTPGLWTSSRGQLGGHCVLVNTTSARRICQALLQEGASTAFDVYLSQHNFRTKICVPNSFFQDPPPASQPFGRTWHESHRHLQDFTVFSWPAAIALVVILVAVFLFRKFVATTPVRSNF